jgi:hypothetical protein
MRRRVILNYLFTIVLLFVVNGAIASNNLFTNVSNNVSDSVTTNLVVYPLALNVELTSYQWGGGSVSYVVPASYPEEVLDYIKTSLSLRGWKITNEQTTSVVPDEKKYVWIASWRDDQGQQVDYTVSYRFDITDNAKMASMTIYGGLTPGAPAQQTP